MRAILAFFFALFAVSAFADLTVSQRQTLASAINAETNATLVACRTVRDDGCIRDWYNTTATPTTLAWRATVSRRDLFLLTDTDSYAGRTAGQREMWNLLMENAPVDMRIDSMRLAVSKIWAAADRDVILTGCTEGATRFEMLFGGSSATTGTVAAIKRNVLGPLGLNDVSRALNGE